MRTSLLMALLWLCLISRAQNPASIQPQFPGNNQFIQELQNGASQDSGVIPGQGISNFETEFPGQNIISMMASPQIIEETKSSNSPADNFAPQQIITVPQGWSGISGFIIPDIPGIETLFKPIMDKFVILYNQNGMYYPDQNINTLVNWDPQAGYIAKFTQPASLGFSGQVNTNRTITLNAGWNLIPVLSNCPLNVAEFFQTQDMVVVKDVAFYKLYWPTMGINTLNELLPGKAYYVLMNAPGEITFPDCTVPAWQCGEPFVDPRDSRVYNTVQIGAQCWMAQNLNFGNRVNGNTLQTYNETPEKYCYNDQEANCYIYGGLYQWDEMMQYSETPGAQGICPEGWYIPDEAEWTWLTNFLGGSSSAGGSMKEIGITHWSTPNTGASNSSGFTALPGGTRDLSGSFSNQNFFGNFWTSTGVDADLSTRRILAYNQAQISANNYSTESGLSVRCRKRETLQITPEIQTVDDNAGSFNIEITSSTSWIVVENVNWITVTPMSGNGNNTLTLTYDANIVEEPRSGEITITAAGASPVVTINITQLPWVWSCGNPIEDARDGKIYPTVQIGTQCWLAQNLNIGSLTSEFDNHTNNNTIEKYCLGNSISNCDVYGGLYQWDEMMQYSNGFGLKGICPEGWHLPSDDEWDVLSNTLDGTFIAGGKLKSTGTIEENTGLWYAPNYGADNSSGFSLLPSGFRQTEGGIAEPGYFSMLWSTDYNSAAPITYVALYDTPEFFPINSEMTFGNSVRCIMNDSGQKFTEISPSFSEVPALPGSFAFTVNSNTSWTVIEDVPWLTVTPVSGSNVGQFTVNYEENVMEFARDAFIYVQSENKIIDLHMTQSGFIAQLSVTPTTKTIPDIIGSTTFEINSNTSWVVDENVSWFTINPLSGSNNDVLTLSYEANPNTDQRIGQFTLVANGGKTAVTVSVIQLGLFNCGILLLDPRDEKYYNTVQIGAQCWMAQNLNIGTMISGSSNQENNGIIEKYCYNNSESSCDIYGGLYQWNEMMLYSALPGIQGICPTGWHVPSDDEWTLFENFVSSQPEYLCNNNTSNIAKSLASTTGWNSNEETCTVGNNQSNNNATGFTGLPAGYYYYTGSFKFQGSNAIFWSANQYSSTNAWYRNLFYIASNLYRLNLDQSYGFSVRCLKDENTTSQLEVTPSNQNITAQSGTTTLNISSNTAWTVTENVSWLSVYPTNGFGNGTVLVSYDANPEYNSRTGQVTITAEVGWPVETVSVIQSGWLCGELLYDSRDGNSYTTIEFGTQCWMKQNLNIGTRINGNGSQSNNGTIEKYCYNDSSAYCDVYGGLYQWDEMMQYSTNPGVQGICPQAWHVPTEFEWGWLKEYIKSQAAYICGNNPSYIGKSLASNTGWTISSNSCAIGNNQSSNNISGFTILPSGYLNYYNDYTFEVINKYAFYWNSTMIGVSPIATVFHYVSPFMIVGYYNHAREDGGVVRCIKN